MSGPLHPGPDGEESAAGRSFLQGSSGGLQQNQEAELSCVRLNLTVEATDQYLIPSIMMGLTEKRLSGLRLHRLEIQLQPLLPFHNYALF